MSELEYPVGMQTFSKLIDTATVAAPTWRCSPEATSTNKKMRPQLPGDPSVIFRRGLNERAMVKILKN